MVILKTLNDQIQIQIQEGQNLLLGRLLKCDIALEDASISSQHARLKLKDGHLRVVDMDSTNGTRLNYQLVTHPVYLQDGDTIEFGNVTFVVDGPSLSSPEEPNPSAQTMTSLEPIDASQKLEDTMLSSLELSEEELAEANRVDTSKNHIPESMEVDHHQPVRLAFALALLIILISGILLLLHLWNTPPHI